MSNKKLKHTHIKFLKVRKKKELVISQQGDDEALGQTVSCNLSLTQTLLFKISLFCIIPCLHQSMWNWLVLCIWSDMLTAEFAIYSQWPKVQSFKYELSTSTTETPLIKLCRAGWFCSHFFSFFKKNNKYLFLTVLEAGKSRIKTLADLMSSKAPLPGL